MSSVVVEAGEVSFAALHAVVDDALAVDLTRSSDDGLLAGLQELQRVQNRLATVEHALIAEVDSRGVAQQHLCADTAALLARVLRLTVRQAKGRTHAAFSAGPRRTSEGEPLEPVFGHVAAAQADGAISPALAALVVETVDRLPGDVAAEQGEAIEHTLVQAARTLDTREMALACERMQLTVDPDGTLADESYRQRMRDLRIRPRPDGSATVSGELTAEASEKFRTVLDTVLDPPGTCPRLDRSLRSGPSSATCSPVGSPASSLRSRGGGLFTRALIA